MRPLRWIKQGSRGRGNRGAPAVAQALEAATCGAKPAPRADSAIARACLRAARLQARPAAGDSGDRDQHREWRRV